MTMATCTPSSTMLFDILRVLSDHCVVESKTFVAHQGFAGQFEQNTLELRLHDQIYRFLFRGVKLAVQRSDFFMKGQGTKKAGDRFTCFFHNYIYLSELNSFELGHFHADVSTLFR